MTKGEARTDKSFWGGFNGARTPGQTLSVFDADGHPKVSLGGGEEFLDTGILGLSTRTPSQFLVVAVPKGGPAA